MDLVLSSELQLFFNYLWNYFLDERILCTVPALGFAWYNQVTFIQLNYDLPLGFATSLREGFHLPVKTLAI